MRANKHEEHDTQIIAAELGYAFLEIPRWQVWKWYPIARHLDLMGRIHSKCCGFSIDD